MARTPADFPRRFKAALAYKGIGTAELAAVVPEGWRLSKTSLDRIAQGRRAPTDYELRFFADALEVPERFLRHGWEESTNGHQGEVSEMAAAIRALTETVEQQSAWLAELLEPGLAPERERTEPPPSQ